MLSSGRCRHGSAILTCFKCSERVTAFIARYARAAEGHSRSHQGELDLAGSRVVRASYRPPYGQITWACVNSAAGVDQEEQLRSPRPQIRIRSSKSASSFATAILTQVPRLMEGSAVQQIERGLRAIWRRSQGKP